MELNGYTFRGSNSAIFIFASILNGSQLLKERICSTWSKFFLLKVDPLWKAFFICSMADGISFEVSLSLNCTDLYKRGGGA